MILENCALHSTRVLTKTGLAEATIFVQNGKIVSIDNGHSERKEFPLTSYQDNVIMPGLIDSHVHINEPGRTDWEGFETATKSAAAGGITTLVDMPLNSTPVTTNIAAFQEKVQAAQSKLYVNCGFWGGVIPDNIHELDALLDAGVFGIKAFLTHSGIDDFPNVTESDLRKALPILKKHNTTILVHCEIEQHHSGIDVLSDHPNSYKAYLNSRPKEWEDRAIDLMIKLCDEYRVPTHIVHLSSSNSIEKIAKAKANGLPITVETCPHYLVFNAEEIGDGRTEFKCAPPIREKANNDLLWNAVKDGLIDFIVTDHSPAPPDLKELSSGNFKTAWGGIAGLQFSLPATWTEARKRGISLEKVSDLMSWNVSKFLGLEGSKGKIDLGYDADFVVWNPEKEFTVKQENIQHRHKVTPFLNRSLFGEIKSTYISGNHIFNSIIINKKFNSKILYK